MQLQNYRADKCVLSVDGISAEAGLSLYYSNEAPLVRKMIEYSSSTIVVADSSKVGKSVFAKISGAEKMNMLITNSTDKTEQLQKLKKLGVKIFHPEKL